MSTTRILLLIVAMLSAILAKAQVSARSAFSTAPRHVLPSLPQPVRLDMLDYYDSGIDRPSANAFGDDTRIVSLTDDMMTIANGDIQSITIAVLPQTKGEIIMLINRLDTPSTDAAISFYNSRWQHLDDDAIFLCPSLSEWTGKIGRSEREDLENALPFIMADATYDPTTRLLTLTRQDGDFIAEADRPLVDRLVKDKLVYRWDGKKFSK